MRYCAPLLALLTMAMLYGQQGRPTTWYREEFPDGSGNWTTRDYTYANCAWHISDMQAAGQTPDGGHGWWAGVEDLGGYGSGNYRVLDTPAIVLPADAHLTFRLIFNTEDPVPAGLYDGWDAGNVRISTDGGSTWNVLSGQPAYPCGSVFSFGFLFGEGNHIPGWGGDSGGWVDADFDLSAYAGQSVIIRFAFASDQSYCTADNPSLIGMAVDNIVVGSYSNDAEAGAGGMTASSLHPLGGDLWHWESLPDAPSPGGALVCSNGTGVVASGMKNALISPPIALPQATLIRADLMLRGGIDSLDTDQGDYYRFDVSRDDGEHWAPVSNPTSENNGDNGLFYSLPEDWQSWSASTGFSGDITCLAESTVRFRILLNTDYDSLAGEGIMIDDFRIDAESAGVGDHPVAPPCHVLSVFPNPFNPDATIRFELDCPGTVSVSVFDLRGRQVRHLGERRLPAGVNSLAWNGADDQGRPVSSGIYLIRATGAGWLLETKALLLK